MKDLLEEILIRMEQLGGNSGQLIFKEPASESEIIAIENKLGYSLPGEFRNTLLAVSSHCEFQWFLPNDFLLPVELKGIFCGELHWGLDLILQFNESKDQWVKEVFPNSKDEYDKVWHNKFAFQEVGNGNYIAIDLLPGTYGQVIYLSHDDGEGHGYTMANSFYDLLKVWIKLGCVGGEDWQWLPFCKSKTSCIDPDCNNAHLWYKTIGIE